MIHRRRLLERKATAMAIVVALQIVAATFFVVDAAGDVLRDGLGAHLLVEGPAALALLVGVLFGAWQVRGLVLRSREDEMAVATARGALADLIRLRFSDWHLTAAEADVALFALKGFDIAEIAGMRGAAPGTVRAQLAKIYGKAGINSQAGLIALFVEDLLDDAPPPGDGSGA